MTARRVNLKHGRRGGQGGAIGVELDRSSCYISKEFRVALQENGLSHHRIRPHCPDENGLMEGANPTIPQHAR